MTTVLDINQFVYRTGTITIAPGDTVATFTGTMLNSGPVKDGDELSVGGTLSRIKAVLSDTTVELFTPYVGAAVTSGSYVIFKSSLLRYHSALIAIDVGNFLARLNDEQIIHDVPGDEPDVSIGKEGDLALKVDITPWKLWLFTAGVWELQDPPAEKGDPGTPGADGTDATIEVGDTVTLAPDEPATVENVGTPGAAILNFGIPAGAGATVEVDSTVTGAAGTEATVENIGDEVNARLKFTIPKGMDGTGVGDMIAANNLSELTDTGVARENLGATTLGDALFTAADAETARTALGAVGSVRKQKFESSSTYIPDPKLLYAIIECVGGGGSGGGGTGDTTLLANGGGGGSGGYSRTIASAETIGISQAVTIGAGGTAPAAGNTNGAAGGDTSVGSLCIAKGGSGGLFSSTNQAATGGAGGVAGTGDFVVAGNAGQTGAWMTGISSSIPILLFGAGASSYFGGGAPPVNQNGGGSATNGANANNYGGGGSGGNSNRGALTFKGGNGSAGVVFITEFCSE